MATEIWRWQNDEDGSSGYPAAVTLPDGHLLVAGYEASDTSDRDFLAIKIDPSDGSLIWKWKDGSNSTDQVRGAAVGKDGSIFLAGRTEGNWSEPSQGDQDYAAVKLDANGSEIWRLQGGSVAYDEFRDVEVGQDGYPVFGGRSSEEFYLLKVDDNGDTIWDWSDSSSGEDWAYAVAMPGNDNSVVLAGKTSGNWSGTNAGDFDQAAVMVDSDGNEVWRWQNGYEGMDSIYCGLGTEDGSIFLVGETFDSTEEDLGGGTPLGLGDIVAFKLHINGTELWKWQGGTVRDEYASGAALLDDGSLIIGGSTQGNWDGINQGQEDFMLLSLNASNGNLLSLEWQAGTSSHDWQGYVTAGPSSEWVALVGHTYGSFARNNSEVNGEGAIVMFTTDASTIGPSPMPTLAPTTGVISTEPMPPVATATPLPQAPSEALAPSSLGTSAPASSSEPGSSSPVLVISVVVSIASAVALFALVSCRGRILVRLRRRYTRNRANGGVPGKDDPRASSRAQEGPDVVPNSYDVQPKYTRHSSTSLFRDVPDTVVNQSTSAASPADLPAYDDVAQRGTTTWGHEGELSATRSQEAPATVVSQPRSAHEVDVPPGYDDMMQRDASRSSSSSVCKLGNDGSTAANRSDATPAGVPEDVGLKTTLGAEPMIWRSAATPSKPWTLSCAVDEVLQLRPSTSRSTASISPTHASSEAETSGSGSAIAEFNATNKSKSESSSGPGVGLGQAILETARELAQASMVPAVSEAATMISVLVRLVTDSKQSDIRADGKLRWCRTIVTLLGRAAYILGEGEGLPDDVEGDLLQEIRESIDDLVQLIQMYRSKNKMVRVITSTLFKRRQEALESTINGALSHLQVGLQLHGGHKLNAVRQDVKDALLVQQQQRQSPQVFLSDDAGQSRAEWRRQRRQRQLEQLEIPEEQLTLTDELLGKGGFGSVYMADYNGRNAAAKVLAIEHDLAGSEESGSGRGLSRGDSSQRGLGLQSDQRRAFFRELDVMRRLRSPYTVIVYGAVTSRQDRLIMVMELMSGGDLRKVLKSASGPIAEERARRIVGEVCAGMAFLHDKQTIHGDLKSANVLFDGYGKAKICDFGTSRWAQHAGSTDLATYTSGVNKGTPMSLPWTAPEVLNRGERSFKSDVYSFGMVTWEVLTRNIPWANESEVLQIFQRVVFKEERPDIPDEAPSDLAEIVRFCWMTEPSRRPSFQWLLKNMKSNGWKEV